MVGNSASLLIKAAGLPGARVVRFSGYEGISTLYEFQVEVAAGELVQTGLIGGAAGSLSSAGRSPKPASRAASMRRGLLLAAGARRRGWVRVTARVRYQTARPERTRK